MGHFIFIVLHVVAVLFAIPLLVLTVPMHLIYGAAKDKRSPAPVDVPSPDTHVRCPDCRELVRADAVKCKHCGAKLVPQQLST